MTKQQILNGSLLPISLSDDLLKILIPATVAIVLFILGLLTAYLKSNSERRRETKNLRNVITTWIPNLTKPIKTLADSCNDLSERLLNSKELTTEQFKFNHLHVSKISGIELTKTLKTFITNSTGDSKLKNSNTYVLVVTLEFFDKVESEIKNKYDEHYQYTNGLMKEWNTSFNKFDNLNQKVHQKFDNKVTARLNLEGELARISNGWLQEINQTPRNIEITLEKLIKPYDEIIANYFRVNGTKEDDLMELMSNTQDLKIIYNQWKVYNEGYTQIFKEFYNKLNKAHEELLNASIYFSTKTKVKWLCS